MLGLTRTPFAVLRAPQALFLVAAIVVGCGGAGGSSSTGLSGGSTGVTTGATTGATTGSTTGSTTGGNGLFNVVYSSDSTGTQQLYKIKSDATGRTQLNTNSLAASLPAVNAVGTKVAFVVVGTFAHINVMNLDGSGLTDITLDNSDNTDPRFSPDGTKIVFASNRSGTNQIYTMAIDGTGLQQLTTLAGGASEPCFSPNGQKIAFVLNTGSDDVYIMNADGSSPTPLAATAVNENQPVFSPDGTKIAFVKDFGTPGNPNGQIMIMNVDGSALTQLTTSMQNDLEPIFSPSGAKLLFTRDTGGTREVFWILAAGGTATALTSDVAVASHPGTMP